MSKRKSKVSKKALKSATKTLRAARDLMNHGGKHWIKGAEQRYVRKDHEPGGHGFSEAAIYEGMEPAYCSIGAIKKVAVGETGVELGEHEDTAPLIAMITLAELIDPVSMKRSREDAERSADRENEYYGLKKSEREKYIIRLMYPSAESIVVTYNDDDKRTWDDVRDKFTRAARRLSDRAR